MLLKVLPSPDYLDAWIELIRPIAKERFNMWAETGEPVSLFRGMSDLVMRLLLCVFIGPKFAEKHADELVPMVQAYERALQKPQTKALPRWLSKEGRLLEAVEERISCLIKEEALQRLENPKQYEQNMDYLQAILNNYGGKYLSSIPSLDIILIYKVYGLHLIGVVNGGHTNQTTTFAWSLLHALRSPLLDTLRQQKTNGLLEATFRETGRLYTSLMLLRRITVPQVILGKHVPKDAFVACSPVVTARDPNLFAEPTKFRPERWLTPAGEFDDAKLKSVNRSGAWVQFGKGQHACLGEKLGKSMVMMYWSIVLGNDEEPGFDVEIVSGVREGVGLDNVGVEGAWAEENLGTPFVKGDPVIVRFSKRSK